LYLLLSLATFLQPRRFRGFRYWLLIAWLSPFDTFFIAGFSRWLPIFAASQPLRRRRRFFTPLFDEADAAAFTVGLAFAFRIFTAQFQRPLRFLSADCRRFAVPITLAGFYFHSNGCRADFHHFRFACYFDISFSFRHCHSWFLVD